MNKLILAAIATAFAANVAVAQSVTEANGVLTSAGRTLYTFDKDAAGKSNCNGGCAAAWPPFMAKDGAQAAGDYRVITREDGNKQWTLNDKPLYFFAADSQPGDIKGDGQGGVWHAVKNAGKRSDASPAPTQASGGTRAWNNNY
jgi:predicted lipoprotein with Yx(FWY)xxD motif